MSWSGLFFLLYHAVAIVTIIYIVMDNRQPAKTMAWALVIYFVPVVGILLYIFFGANTRKERYVGRRSMDELTKRSMLKYVEQHDLQLPDTHQSLISLFINQSFSLPFRYHGVQFLTDGYQFFPSLLRDIAQARDHIHVDMYIFEDDALGRLMSDALIQKSSEGVAVRVIYDDVGCWSVGSSFFERMREAGIEVVPFMPVRFPRFTSRANYRNHRKIIVIDGRVGYIGGMNIALRYVKGRDDSRETGKNLWRDTMARIEGSAVYALQRTFLIDWYFVDRTLLSDRKFYPPMPEQQEPGGTSLIQVVTSGPGKPNPEIMQGFVRIIMAARRYIYIETPYFLPTESVLLALKTAVSMGIDVRVLVPRRSDAHFTDWASRSYLREALVSGMQVLFYEEGFLHSKFMVSDDTVSTCGSTNIDFRSFENNFEANAFFYDADAACRLRDIFLDDVRQATPLTDIPHRLHPRFMARMGESFARLLSPLL